MINIDAEEELAKCLREELDKEFVRIIIRSAELSELGWTRVEVHTESIFDDLSEMVHWAEEHSKSKVELVNNAIFFEDNNEALIFRLRWTS